jgi:galactose-1-phosphate uridylyltransferase
MQHPHRRLNLLSGDWVTDHGEVMLDAVGERKAADGERMLEANTHWLAVVRGGRHGRSRSC